MLRASWPWPVHLFVCHTQNLYENGGKQNYEIFTVGCHKNSSLLWQNFMPLGAGVPIERGRQRGVPPKRRYFAAICSFSVKTVADRYKHAVCDNKQ